MKKIISAYYRVNVARSGVTYKRDFEGKIMPTCDMAEREFNLALQRFTRLCVAAKLNPINVVNQLSKTIGGVK